MKIANILTAAVFTIYLMPVAAQPFYFSITGGMAGYSGDLQAFFYNPHNVHVAAGANLKFDFNRRMSLRIGYNYGFLSASDVNNNWDLRFRNLSFATSIHEGNLIIETDLLSREDHRLVPYLSTGLGMFHFNPYYRDVNSGKVFLHDLGTEGQKLGLASPYKLTQATLIGGGGIKFQLSESVLLTYEIGVRKLFTDYLDDVSTTYNLPSGSSSLSFAFKELGTSYDKRFGKTRGSSERNDIYYFGSIGVSIGIGDLMARYFGIESTRSPVNF